MAVLLFAFELPPFEIGALDFDTAFTTRQDAFDASELRLFDLTPVEKNPHAIVASPQLHLTL